MEGVRKDEEVWKRFEEWRKEQYRKAERREIYWDECEKAISEELWRVAGEVRKEQRRKLCEEVEKMLERMFEIVERMSEICDKINKDKLLSLTGRWYSGVEARIMLDEVIAHAILWLATLANGIPEWEQRTLKWKERWERRGGRFKSFPL